MKLDLQTRQKLLFSQRMQKSLALLSLSNEELCVAIQRELLENPLLEQKESHSNLELENFRIYDSLESFPEKQKTFRGEGFLEVEKLKPRPNWKEQLLKQSRFSFFSKKLKQDIEMLISYLDEQAYLRVDVEGLALKKGLSKQRIKKALSCLQSFEPLGVGARSLEECLLIQVQNQKKNKPLLKKLIRHYLPFLKDKKYPYIAAELKISLEKLKKLCKELEKLNPYPLSAFSSEPTIFVRPDLYIYKQKGSFCVIFNKDNLPSLKISHNYFKQIQRQKNFNKTDRKYLREKKDSARLFILSLELRQAQIKKIATCLIKHQLDFFHFGPDYLKPLSMSELAKETGISVSTISRTANNKYIHTPHGLMPMRAFFLSASKGLYNNPVSVDRVKQALRAWIADEKEPFSDEALRMKLKQELNVTISRRRISQYRASLNIPPAYKRRLKRLYA